MVTPPELEKGRGAKKNVAAVTGNKENEQQGSMPPLEEAGSEGSSSGIGSANSSGGAGSETHEPRPPRNMEDEMLRPTGLPGGQALTHTAPANSNFVRAAVRSVNNDNGLEPTTSNHGDTSANSQFVNHNASEIPTVPNRNEAIPLPAPILPAQPLHPFDENDHPYVGLVNQAMTCYLNSLIQSLYMTPEFRNALYRWEYKPSAEKKSSTSIAHQLQKLFVLLQTTDRDSLETKDLTTSFGWSNAEAYEQHDVQELCRLMFDALELRWKGTHNEKLIQDLYRGSMQDFVKCLKCGKENVRADFFLDLSLPIKPFGASSAFKSIEEALRAFVTPERLYGSNQYFCERCKSKQDGHKGLRVTTFPYLLTIQLKRFDFDYTTMQRIKLNDRMSFPDVLNLNPFVEAARPEKVSMEEKDGTSTSTDNESEMNPNSNSNTEAITSEDSCLSAPQATQEEKWGYGTRTETTDKFGRFVSVAVGQPLDKELVATYKKQGEYVYELFSIMMHQGNAAGGHYFAYIKNMEQERWYCFNDSRVEVARKEDIERSFGGSAGGWTAGNMNAYMLFYRKIDPSKNKPFTKTKSLPRHMTQLLEQWRLQTEEEEKQKLYLQSLLNVTIRLNIPCDYGELLNDTFNEEIPKTKTLEEVFNMATKHFEEKAKTYGLQLRKNCARFILCSTMNGIRPVCAYVSKADRANKTLEQLLETKISTKIELLLDYRIGSNFVEVISGSGRMVRVSVVDIANRSVRPYFYVHIPDGIKMIKVKQRIGESLNDEPRVFAGARIVVEKQDRPPMGGQLDFLLLDNNANFYEVIEKEVFSSNPMVYYDGGHNAESEYAQIAEADRQKPLAESTMFTILDRRKFAMLIKVRFPSQEELSRAASVCGAYARADVEEINDVVMESIQGEGTCTDAGSSADLGEDEREASMGGWEASGKCAEVDAMEGDNSDTEMRSGRGSEVGSCASGSAICNTTPQVSPNVSDVDDSPNQFEANKFTSNLASRISELSEPGLSLELTGSGNPFAGATASSTSATPTHKSVANSDTVTIVPTGDSEKKIIIKSSERNVHVLDVDRRMTMGELRDWAAEQLHVSAEHIALFKHYNENDDDRGYEHTTLNESFEKGFVPNGVISIRMRPPLKEHEKLIHVFLFDTNEPIREQWRVLFDVPVSIQTSIRELGLKCIRLYNDLHGLQLQLNQIRFREAPEVKQRRNVLRMTDTLASREHLWAHDIYMQILPEPVVTQPGEPIMVRRFRSSTVEISPIEEVFIDEQSADQAADLIQAISTLSRIPPDRVLLAEITAWENKWPYTKNRLDMLSGKVRFVTRFSNTMGGKFTEKYGSAIIYYKDSEEATKELTDEEKKEIAIADSAGVKAAANRRKERPLRIQMSSVSEA